MQKWGVTNLPKIQTRTCIDTGKEQVTRRTLEDREKIGVKKPKKKGGGINEE